MTSTPDVARIVAGLSEAQVAVVCAGSRRPKAWRTIRRHAKVHRNHRFPNFGWASQLFDQVSEWPWKYRLNDTGLAVRQHIIERGG